MSSLLSGANLLNIPVITPDSLLLYSHFQQYYQIIDIRIELEDFCKENTLSKMKFLCVILRALAIKLFS